LLRSITGIAEGKRKERGKTAPGAFAPPKEALIKSGLLNTVHGLHGLTRIFGTKTLLIRENPWIFPLSI
jgi:hypothetical protein